MRITIDGTLAAGVSAKDIALAWIAQLGTDGARGHAVEYAGTAVRALSMEGRMTLCNLSIEGGARFGMIAPDDVTLDYLKDRPFAPKGPAWAAAVDHWRDLRSDPDAPFDRDVKLDAATIAPTLTWGTSPEQALPVTAKLPMPDTLPCTNGRIEDLRAAADVLKGRRAQVPGLVSPGSARIKAQAEAEGLADIFTQAGLTWAEAGCSMCVGMNGDLVAAGQRCASSTNRNFRGRQGRGARTHLMSPAMVAAAAVTGTLTDVRPLLQGRGS